MDKKVLKEWKKISDYNVLNNIEELEQLFISCPNGKCMRKYTAYPWSKENFFFGSVQDLLDWYKTTDEIPFFTNNYIDKKFGHLTIIGFKRDKENNNDLIAICLCECGNIAELNFRKVRHGDFVSCGCRARKQKFVSLYDSFKNIIDEKWDYDKNLEDPKLIPFDTKSEYWWKGYNHSYLMSPATFLVKSKGTSFPEQAILYFLKQHFEDVESRYKLEIDGKKYEADIYLRDLKVAIEYDGVAWHKNKLNEDINKSEKLTNNGIYLIRIRESGLISFDVNNMSLIQCDIDNLNYFDALSFVINEILTILYKKCGNKKLNHKVSSETIKRDKVKIESQYLIGYQKNNIANHFLSKHWVDSNMIEKYKISIDSSDRFLFACNDIRNLHISPKSILNIYKKLDDEQKIEFEENLLTNNECPFIKMPECPCNAIYHENAEKPCKFFKEFGEKRIYKDSILEEYAISMDKIRLTKFKDFYNDYKKFITNITDFTKETLDKLIYYFQNALFYHVKDVKNIFIDFVNLNISNDVKLKYLENSIKYPYMTREDVARCFTFSELKYFYVTNYEYNKMFKGKDIFIFNTKHEFAIIDVLKNLIYQHKIVELKEIFDIIHKKISQPCYDLLLKSLSILIAIKPTYKYKELSQSIKIYNNFVNVITLNTSPETTKEIQYICSLSQSEARKKYIFQFIDNEIQNNTLTREKLDSLYNKFDNDKAYFLQKISGYIKDGNKTIINLFKKEIEFSRKYNEDLQFADLNNVYRFQEDYIPNMLEDYPNMSDNEIRQLIFGYSSFFSYVNLNLKNVNSPQIIYEALVKYGFGHVDFKANVFDSKYMDLLFDFIIKIYDRKMENSDYLICTDKMLKVFEDAILNNTLSEKFLNKYRETIKYIQERNKRNSNSYTWVNDIDDFNKLIGINKKSR